MAEICAEMSGTITKILVKVGDAVAENQDVVSMESMKMELFVSSDDEGTVQAIHVKEGEFVNEGSKLITLS